MAGWNLANQDLSGAKLAKATVTEANFSGSILTAEQLAGTASYKAKDLHGIDFSDLDLTGWNFASQNLTGAKLAGTAVTTTNFSGSNLTAEQLASTASYQALDLHGIGLSGNNLDGWNLANQNLWGANLTKATVVGTDFSYSNLTAKQVAATASYKAKDMHGIGLAGVNLTSWNLANQNLTGANLRETVLTKASLKGATVAGAHFDYSNLTAAQLYSTASYRAKDLHGISLQGNELRSWNLAGQNLSGANLSGANLSGTTLTGADLSRADLRRAYGGSLNSAVTQNAILPDGTIQGLDLAAGESLVIRNHPWYLFPITVASQVSLDPDSSLQIVLDGQPWRSTILFDAGISVSLAGKLELTLASGVDLSTLAGQSFQLFDWTGVSHTGLFQTVADPGWDLSQLYTSGEVTFGTAVGGLFSTSLAGECGGSVLVANAVPEPSCLALFGATAASLLAYACQRRRNSGSRHCQKTLIVR